jgi:hypothetical protein
MQRAVWPRKVGVDGGSRLPAAWGFSVHVVITSLRGRRDFPLTATPSPGASAVIKNERADWHPSYPKRKLGDLEGVRA